jgi:hypothetical protein
MRSIRWGLPLYSCAIAAFAGIVPNAFGQSADEDASSLSAPAPSPVSAPAREATGINWNGLLVQSLEFLSLEHGFRYMTEEGTRHPHVSFWGGYTQSLQNLHGWADGDPFLVNYVGHPMQGGTAGFLFVQNDRSFRRAGFGKNSRYWKSRLRATAFSWAYSEQFEIGPLSEATIGNTQGFFPQQGFADHVATPAIGLGWMVTEDAIDKYLIRRIEGHTRNPYVWAAVRGGLNPTRSLANVLGNHLPWHRDTRCDPWQKNCALPPPLPRSPEHGEYPQAATMEVVAATQTSAPFGTHARGYCIGGGAEAAFRVAQHWEVAAKVSGCKLTRFGDNLSGDSLTYIVGPRWTPRPAERWQPFVQILVGGRKLTHERIDPLKKAELEAIAAQQGRTLSESDHALYTQLSEISGTAVSAGAGLDLRLAPAIGFRIGQFDYLHSFHAKLTGISYTDTAQFTSGLILRFGTW